MSSNQGEESKAIRKHPIPYEQFVEDMIDELCRRQFGANSPFSDIPGRMTQNARIEWVKGLMESGRRILRIAYGISIINNHPVIDEDDIASAFNAFNRGIKRYVNELVPEHSEE